MKERLINHVSLTRRLRQLLVLFALLLLPAGMWAENYDLWIGETQVTSDNASNILAGDNTNDGKVSFIASSNTLVLNGVETGKYIKSSLDNLTIKFSGTNKVHDTASYPDYDYDAIFSTVSTATLTFVKDGDATLQLYAPKLTTTVIKGFASVSYSSGDGQCYLHSAKPCIYSATDRLVNIYDGGAISEVTISGETAYPLWFISDSDVATQVTSSTITANVTEGTVTFDSSNNKLSINEAKINGKILSALGNFTLDLQGANFIATTDSGSVVRSANAGTLTITETGDNATLQLNVPEYDWNEYPVIQGFTALSYVGFNLAANPGATYGVYYVYDSDEDEYDRIIYGLYDSNRQEGSLKRITNALFTTANLYPVWVAGTQVSSDNKLDVLGEGKVSFNTSNNTLTLNGINITGPIFYNDATENLTISLNGTNEININQDLWYSDAIVLSNNASSASLIIKKTDNAESCSLKVNAGNSDWRSITGFSNVTWTGLNAVAANTVSYDTQNRYLLTGDGSAWNVEFTTATAYNIVVDGVPVTSSNASNVLSDDYASVSYSDGTLTLKGAQITSLSEDAIIIDEEVEALTVRLVGYNQIGAYGHYTFNLKGNTALTFTTSDKMPGSLVSAGNVFIEEQQLSVTYQNGLALISENKEIKAETGTMKVTPLTGTDYYLNTDNGDGTAYMYTQPYPFSFTKAVKNGDAVVVSTPENATATELWTSLNQPANVLKYTLQFDWGTCTNKNVMVQVVGYNQQEEEPYGWVADGETYSDAVALSTADNDGIIEIPIKKDITSSELRLRFSSNASFSFVALSVGITIQETYPLTIGDIVVTNINSTGITGEGITGTVTFTPADALAETPATLTLNGATLTKGIAWSGSDDLYITIVGTNSITTTSGSCIAYSGVGAEVPSIRFERGSDDDCTLTLSCATGTNVITGFSNSDAPFMPESGFFWLPTTDSNKAISSATITSSPFSGGDGESASTAYLISTPQNLMNLSTLCNAGKLNSKFYKLTTDIDCENLTGFEPIGTPEKPFIGHFDGASHKISNLLYEAGSEDDYAGLFCKVGDNGDEPAPGYVSDLTLENCTFRNGNMYNGAIAGILNKGTIDNCTVTSCNILSETSQPSSGGIVGGLFGGSITNCIVSGSTITATSVAGGLAGGIVAFAYGSDNGSATVSGCQVTGTATNPTTITSSSNYDGDQGDNPTGGIVGDCGDEYSIVISNNKVSGNTTISSIDYDGTNNYTCAGAIVGEKGNASFSNNYYYYSVTTSTKNGEAEVVERSGYQQRGTGFAPYNYQLQQETEDYDITTSNGAVMYTKVLTLPVESPEGYVMSAIEDITREGGFYDYASEGYGYLVAPGQPVYLKVMPSVSDGYNLSSISVTYGTDQTAEITKTSEEDGELFYTITAMPDADATLNVTFTKSYDLWIGDTQVTSENATHILGENNTTVTFTSVFDDQTEITTNTLTLNGAELTVPVIVGLDNLTIDIQGKNSITTDETCLQKIDNAAPAVTFKSTSTPVGSLTLKTTGDGGVNTFGEYNVGSFSISEELTLIMKNSGYVYSNPYYFTDGTTKEAVFAPAYDIIVGEMPVTMGNADDIFGGQDDGQVSYDAENNILTLNSAMLYGEGKNIVYSGSDNLTIALNGSNYVNSIVYEGQETTKPSLTFKKIEGALPGTTLRTPSDFRESFSTVNYEDWLGLNIDDSYPNDVFYDVVSKTPSFNDTWNWMTDKHEVSITSIAEGTVKYSLTYVAENLAEYNKTSETITAEDKITLRGPATIKATVTVGDEVSPEETAYYFGIMPNPLTFVYDGVTAPEFSATLYPNVEGVTFTPYSSPGSFATFSEEGDVTIIGCGSGLAYASLNLPENRTYSVITDSIAFRMNVISPITFAPDKLWATYYSPVKLGIPDGLTAYPVSSVNETTGVVTVPEQGLSYIPANTGVLLNRAEAGATNSYVPTTYTGQTTSITSILQGTSKATSVGGILEGYTDGSTVYVLYNDAFVKTTSGTIPANRGFLVFGDELNAPRLTIEIEGDATGINDVRSKMAEVGSDFYDLSGRKLSGKPTKSGLYIKNGTKVLVK